jgi:hypothetical protein
LEVHTHTHTSFYVGVTLQSLVFQSPGTGQVKKPETGLENAGYQNAWGADLTFFVRTKTL